MDARHKKRLNVGSPFRELIGQPNYRKKPSNKKILNELLDGLANFKGMTWSFVSPNGGYDVAIAQCGESGYVFEINIPDKDVANWLVNEINQRRFNGNS